MQTPKYGAALFATFVLVFQIASLPAHADGLEYRRDVAWQVDRVPELAPMEPTIRSILQRARVSYKGVDGQTVEGFFPGANYNYSHIPGWTPFYLYARDTATILPMARYYYGAPAQRSAVEEFLRLQYPDGTTSATVGPDFKVDKATVVSDEETSLVLMATEAYRVAPDRSWLRAPIRGVPLVNRLDRAMSSLLEHRLDPSTRLVKRAHTTDWGDVKWEVSDHPTDIAPGDQWTVSIYDQVIAYAAMRGLAEFHAQMGDATGFDRWEAQAEQLRADTTRVLWQDAPDRGYFRIHVHLEPDTIPHEIDEGLVISIGNAAALYYGLATPDQAPRIISALERARVSAGAPKVGLTLDPAYTGWFESQMDPRVYQNGAIWDWWGGRQITGEFTAGYSSLAREHLYELARDWATHPGKVREWESPWLNRTSHDEAYAGAAAVVGEAVVDGLFGIQIDGGVVRLTPRLGLDAGSIRVYEPATDVYVAYRYSASEDETVISYGTNSPAAIAIHLPIPWADSGVDRATLDGRDQLPLAVDMVGEDRMAIVTVPSGSHEIRFHRSERTSVDTSES